MASSLPTVILKLVLIIIACGPHHWASVGAVNSCYVCTDNQDGCLSTDLTVLEVFKTKCGTTSTHPQCVVSIIQKYSSLYNGTGGAPPEDVQDNFKFTGSLVQRYCSIGIAGNFDPPGQNWPVTARGCSNTDNCNFVMIDLNNTILNSFPDAKQKLLAAAAAEAAKTSTSRATSSTNSNAGSGANSTPAGSGNTSPGVNNTPIKGASPVVSEGNSTSSSGSADAGPGGAMIAGIGVGAFIVIVALVGAGYYFYSKSKKGEKGGSGASTGTSSGGSAESE